MKTTLITIILIFSWFVNYSQQYPAFGAEKKVSIIGYAGDAMEPFISPNGNTLFFNSLNSGGNTNVYYATRLNDSTFNFIGAVVGTVDTSSNHLDAVPSLDSANNFFWVSLRGYPTVYENLQRGLYSNGAITNHTMVYGDFNIPSFGWLIMDAGINYHTNQLFFCNAYFDLVNNSCGPGIPCYSSIGIAQRVNDSTFNKLSNSTTVLQLVNDTNYVVYAPQISTDGLSLYYTRFMKNTYVTEICVSVRSSPISNFSLPMVIYSNGIQATEAPTISYDNQKLYYHQKNSAGVYKIYLRYKTGVTSIQEEIQKKELTFYPNPVHQFIYVNNPSSKSFTITIFNTQGEELITQTNNHTIPVLNLAAGIYYIKQSTGGSAKFSKIVKE